MRKFVFILMAIYSISITFGSNSNHFSMSFGGPKEDQLKAAEEAFEKFKTKIAGYNAWAKLNNQEEIVGAASYQRMLENNGNGYTSTDPNFTWPKYREALDIIQNVKKKWNDATGVDTIYSHISNLRFPYKAQRTQIHPITIGRSITINASSTIKYPMKRYEKILIRTFDPISCGVDGKARFFGRTLLKRIGQTLLASRPSIMMNSEIFFANTMIGRP